MKVYTADLLYQQHAEFILQKKVHVFCCIYKAGSSAKNKFFMKVYATDLLHQQHAELTFQKKCMHFVVYAKAGSSAKITFL